MVPEPPKRRHGAARGGPCEAIALDEIGTPPEQGREQSWQVGRVHLSVRAHDDDQLGSQRFRSAAPTRNGRADTPVVSVLDELDAGSELASDARRLVDAAVVDDDELIHEGRHSA